MNIAHLKLSPFDQLNPKTLLVSSIGTAICFSLIQNIILNLLGFVMALIFAIANKRNLIFLFKRLVVANLFILLLWITLPFTVPDKPLLEAEVWGIPLESLISTLSVTIKCNTILLFLLVFVAGQNLFLIGYALKQLSIPDKLVFLFLFTCRYIHVTGTEWKKRQTAASLRGFIPRTSLHTYRTFANMLGLIVINSIDRSHRIHEAMLLRVFSGNFRTLMETKTTRLDFLFTFAFFTGLFILLFADIFLRSCHV